MTYETASARVARKIREMRKVRGWTTTYLADRTWAERSRRGDDRPGLSQTVIANIENGRPDAQGRRRREITLDELELIADALAMNPLMLLEGKDLEWTDTEIWMGEKWLEAIHNYRVGRREYRERLQRREES